MNQIVAAACVALITLLAASGSVSAIFELCPQFTGLKAHETDTSDEYRTELEGQLGRSSRHVLQATQIIAGGYGCTWDRFTNLLDMLKSETTLSAVVLLRIAIVRQLAACDGRIYGVPQGDGLTSDERHRLLQFNSRIAHKDLQSKTAIANAVVGYMRDSRAVDFKAIKRAELDTRMGFRKSFYEEMDFCFKVDYKWEHIYEFIDQIGDLIDIMDTYPVLSDRLQSGMACRVFVFFHQKIEEKAFKKAMTKWYNFRKEVKHIVDPATDYLYDTHSDAASSRSG